MPYGDVSEWLKEAVLKTVSCQRLVGSNPTISAISGRTSQLNTVQNATNLQKYSSGDEAPLLRA